jgi:hypothetical protein
MNLIIEKKTADQLLSFLGQKIEIGGNFIYKDNILTIKTPVYKGTRFHIVFDQSVSAFNFHTHPIEETILFSFYSQGDIVMAFRRQSETNIIRKDFLVTEDGIYSLQVSPKAVSFWKRYPYKAEILFGFYQRYVIENKMNPLGHGVVVPKELRFKYACNIKDMIYMMNTVTGKDIFEWMISEIERNRLSFKDQNQLASFVNLENELKYIEKIYFVNFMPWGSFDKNNFVDRFEFI